MAGRPGKFCATHWPRSTYAADCCRIVVSTNDATWRRSSFGDALYGIAAPAELGTATTTAAQMRTLVQAGVVRVPPVVPHPGCVQGARGDDGGGIAGCVGRGTVDAGGRAVDGDGRVPGRRVVVRIHVPASDRSGYRAISRHPAGAVSWALAGAWTCGWSRPTGA